MRHCRLGGHPRERSGAARRAQLRETRYDLGAAVAELRASGFGDVESQLTESLLEPVAADWVAAFFEHTAGRRADPGPPPPRHAA